MELEEGYIFRFSAFGATYNFTLRVFARGEKTMLYEFVEFKVSDCSSNTITDPNGVWPASISVPKIYENLVVNDKNPLTEAMENMDFGKVRYLKVPVEKF